MDINEIQKLIEDLGAAVIVGEDGPKMIAMSYQTYKDMTMARQHNFVPAITDHDRLTFPEQLAIRAERFGEPPFARMGSELRAGEQELIEKLNQDIALLKEEIKKKELGEL
ncbi:MAG: hypothetical protein Q8Q92_00900 [bacterium]|nr:hypothetical protein [bacterium]